MNAPTIAYAPSDDEPGYRVGIALDELAAWAREEGGIAPDEWTERCEEAWARAYDADVP